VSPVRGEERVPRFVHVGGSTAEVEEQPREVERRAVGRLQRDESATDGGRLLPGQVAVELERWEVLGALGADVRGGRAGVEPRRPGDRIVAKRDVDDLFE
jgi:hypothetical protein